eukprot:COSAG02_NODE_52487_length_307_cov_1.000000_1_plen_53_part_01
MAVGINRFLALPQTTLLLHQDVDATPSATELDTLLFAVYGLDGCQMPAMIKAW